MKTSRTTSTRSARRRAPLGAILAAALAVAAVSAPSPSAAPPSAYGWPVKPFHEQHPVRGYFGDPRIGMTPKGVRSTFHFGIDVSAPNGTPVFATIDGVVVRWSHRPETVAIRADDGRTEFQYWHIAPSVAAGSRVRAYRTVLGRIQAPWAHVHFSELRGGVYVNPLRIGALGPYADTTRPSVKSLRVEREAVGVSPRAVSGSVDLVAEAIDRTPIAVPAPWQQKPVTPAVLSWRLVRRDGTAMVTWRTAVDVRLHIPRDDLYTTVFARWTRQNKASRPGRYRFFLAHGWDTRTVPDGRYHVVVCATDSRGNTTRRAFPLVIANEV
jgi:hypothetical protein